MSHIRQGIFANICALALAAGCAGADPDEGGLDEPSAEGANSDALPDALGSTSQELDVYNGFLPHNQARTFTTPHGCEFVVQHGNFWAAAYIKADIVTPSCSGYVELTAVQNGLLVGKMGLPFSGSDGWSQVQFNWANIVGSDVSLLNTDNGGYDNLHFAGI